MRAKQLVRADAAVLLLAAVLLFAQLGAYSFWDDEALTALGALGVLETGDTSATVDGQLVAFRNGCLVRDGNERSTPPLSIFLPAASLALFGQDSTWAARLPFALCGLASVALVLHWAGASTPRTFAARWIGPALTLNVSFLLYSRQSRYYALGVLLTLVTARLWLSPGNTKRLALAGLSAGLLLASSPTAYAALMACIIADRLLFAEFAPRHGKRGWSIFLGAQLPLVAGVLSIWNPLRTGVVNNYEITSIADRMVLFWWSLRDMSAAEFMAGPLVVAGAVVALRRGDRSFLRGFLAIITFCACIAAITPQAVSNTTFADIRYLTPLLPLGIWLSLQSLDRLTQDLKPDLRALGLAVLLLTNFMHGAGFLSVGLQSTPVKYLLELVWPVDEPYTPTSAWVRSNVKPHESVWVQPDYMVFPLMFHAPAPHYAWQLSDPPPANIREPAPIDIVGRIPPDWVIAFGPSAKETLTALKPFEARSIWYIEAAALPHFWRDLYRPELFWRTFASVPAGNPENGRIRIFKKSATPPPDDLAAPHSSQSGQSGPAPPPAN